MTTMDSQDTFAVSFFSLLFHFFLTKAFGQMETGLQNLKTQVSFKQCVEECNINVNCRSAKYVRISTLCKLYSTENSGDHGPGMSVYQKNNYMFGTDHCNDNDCSNENKPDICGAPVTLPGAKILGNMVSIGSRLKYQCLDGSDWSFSECLLNGSWSSVKLNCKCGEPVDRDGAKLSDVKYWTYQNSETNIIAIAECENEGCDSTGLAVCDYSGSTGIWFFDTNICCNNLGESIDTSSAESSNCTDVDYYCILGNVCLCKAWKFWNYVYVPRLNCCVSDT